MHFSKIFNYVCSTVNCLRPRFETWDLEDVPQVILNIARQQGAEQARDQESLCVIGRVSACRLRLWHLPWGIQWLGTWATGPGPLLA